ncbi:MAG TPA: response regulator transcription factor [Opitutus sp.]|nr:response regulator transcription factor [Opitutus sp.]
MLRILIADDHEVTRRGLKEILQDEFGDVHTDDAHDAAETLRLVAAHAWDLVLLDIIMPGMNVVEVLAEIRRLRPAVPVLILTAVSEMEYVVRTLKAGANGFINKRHASDELIAAIRKVLAGETYLSGEAITSLAATLRGGEPELPHQRLSERELQVFRLIARGKTVKEIAGDLGVSDKTVGTYLARIKEKTGLVSYVEITRYALHHQLVD